MQFGRNRYGGLGICCMSQRFTNRSMSAAKERSRMIRIIEGKRYNTETAICVFSYWNGYSRSDFKFRTKKLYRTKSGAWFLHHDGGAMSDMAVSVGNNGRGGSEAIEPVNDDDAYGFLEAHSDDSEAQDAIGQYFVNRVVDA